jgi:hypothetical protein
MLDGKKHHFSDLLKTNKNVSLKFLFNMFNEMKDLGIKAKKGPGEFALAILSPKISVFGSGDLKIGMAIGGFEVITKMILYYFHERVWFKYINIGRKNK